MYAAGFMDAALPEESYDVITFWHSLEHMRDPLNVLKKARSLLKKNGYIVISTPNILSLQAKLFGRFWYHVDAPRHFYLFSPGSIKGLMDKTGFRVFNISYSALWHNVFGWSMSLRNMFNVSKSDRPDRRGARAGAPKRLFLKTLFALLNVLLLPAVLLEGLCPMGGTIEVIAVKGAR